MADREYVFIWKIENFSSSFHKTGYKIDSPVFAIDNLKKSQWYLEIYPRGETEQYKKYISITLFKKKNDVSPEEFEISYDIDMFGGDGKLLRAQDVSSHVFGDRTTRGWGFPNFLSIKSVSDVMEDWPEDAVTLRCRMHYKNEGSTPECEAVTEIGVDRQSCAWNIEMSDLSSQIVIEGELFA